MASLTGGILGQSLRGKSGEIVFVNVGGETRVRRRVVPSNPQTPAQQANRRVHGRAAAAWDGLDDAAVAAWRAWAKPQGLRPQAAFTGLYGRMIRVDPAAAPPALPPARPFFGDSVVVTATGGASGATFAASAPNGAGVVTELLAQPLASRHRRAYLDKYRHQSYAVFASGSLAVPVSLAPGWYALAARFVEKVTGQATGLMELGVVRIG